MLESLLGYVHRVGSSIVRINRKYLYRVGPNSLITAFSYHLGSPEMRYIASKELYLSEQELNKYLVQDQLLLGSARLNFNKGLERKVAETIFVKQQLISMPNAKYPVVIISLKRNTPSDGITFFENLGYTCLNI